MTTTEETGFTINLAPDSSVYSPHVRVMKDFVEKLSLLERERQEFLATDHDQFGAIENNAEIAIFISDELAQIRSAMSAVLTDDFMLIVDGKRFPGGQRQDR